MRLKWFQRSEEISPWVGLSFGALYLAAVVAVGWAAIHVQRQHLAEQHQRDLQLWANCIANHVTHATAEGPQAVARELRRAGRSPGVLYCATVSASGVFSGSSDPIKVGKQTPTLRWDTTDEPQDIRCGRDPSRPGEAVLVTRLPAAQDQPAEELWVALAALPSAWHNSDAIVWIGQVLLAVMILFLIAYRSLRLAVQPLAVIRRRLINSDQPLGERLLALRLNDSFDEVSTSWNRLIEFVSEMQEELRRNRLLSNVSTAMDGYRSERLTGILMQIPFGVMVVDADGNIGFANRAAAGMLGVPADALEGKPCEQFLEESLRMALLAGGKSSSFSVGRWTDYTLKRPHGEVTLRFWSVPGGSADGEHILFIQDVTQAKEAERARDQFLYHVTHELRTPLTNIRAYAETLSQGVIDDEQTVRECYNVIMGETQRLNRLVEDILNVSQLEVGTARLDLGAVQLDKLMREVVQDMQGSADAKNIDLVLSLPAKVPPLRGDKERLSVVLTNLLGNAIKYTPAGGRVDVRCLSEPGRVRWSVTDSGIGIPPGDQDKIFEKFYRVDDKQVSAVPGTGLGLAIVRETVRLHGGTVSVESTLGKGSTFTVVLPALASEDTGGATPAPAGEAAVSAGWESPAAGSTTPAPNAGQAATRQGQAPGAVGEH